MASVIRGHSFVAMISVASLATYFALFTLVSFAPRLALAGFLVVLAWFSVAWAAAIAQWVYCRYRHQRGVSVSAPLIVVVGCYIILLTGVIYGYFPAV